mmetsp:Transcript_38073/g.88592  ORF Transcript_38073/g.88592 Transcript_38073/m.88592 type:complete len:80 (-) Transcript_38073:1026-1265(-)
MIQSLPPTVLKKTMMPRHQRMDTWNMIPSNKHNTPTVIKTVTRHTKVQQANSSTKMCTCPCTGPDAGTSKKDCHISIGM